MFRFNSDDCLQALFTYSNRKHTNALLRSVSFIHSSSRGGDRKDLPKSVVSLRCDSTAKGGVCHLHLVGALPHALKCDEDYLERQKSCQEVKTLINSLKPQVVFLGLCPTLAPNPKPHQIVAEFQVAYDKARNYGGKVIFGDRPRKITWHRTLQMRRPSLLISSIFLICPYRAWSILEWGINHDPDKVPDHPILRNFTNYQSIAKKYFVDERDQYMSATLLQVAREHNSVVAVVGKCHLPGIQKYWKRPIEVEELLSDTWH